MLTQSSLERLRTKLHGKAIEHTDSEYESARRVYNAMIDRHPKLIVVCSTVEDVIQAVKFAYEEELVVAVRCGGHNGAGLGTCDDGLVIDLGGLKDIQVDATAMTVSVGGGCTWSEVDQATHIHGLATPSGIISSTGVGGLTLGGGIGHLSRKFGLAIDNLLSVDMVLADSSQVIASDTENPDLFWAIRGGGGNFGIVTRFTFRLNKVKDVVAGPVLWPMERAAEVLRWYREFLPRAPEDLNGFFAFLKVPSVDAFPEALHDQTVCGVVFCHCGTAREADNDLASMYKTLGDPLLDGLQKIPFPDLQSMFDPFYPSGHQWYWHGDFFTEISDEAIEIHVKHGRQLPTSNSTMHLYPVDGAVHRVASDSTAFSYRDATYSGVIVGVHPEPEGAEMISQWTKDYGQALQPFSTGGAYVNFMMEEGDKRVKATYRDNYPRLVQIKKKYDPDNFFRINQNIKPATE